MSEGFSGSLPFPDLHGLRMPRVNNVHFVGIGGSGMCGIAELMLSLGYCVSGSDLVDSEDLRRLCKLGATVSIGHSPDNVAKADVVVASTAVADDNCELNIARNRRIPVVPRAEMLAEIMRFRHGIAVAGTHGKTTTTSMIAAVLAKGGLDPTYVVGGLVKSIGANARFGESKTLVVEADESDASFLHLQPMVTVITGLEADHLENFDNDFQRLCGAYLEFIHNLPFYGLCLLCIDDSVLRGFMKDISRLCWSYGFAEDADFRVSSYKSRGFGCQFAVARPNRPSLQVELPVGGRHNALNATAAVAVAAEEGVDDAALLAALASFSGVHRRFEIFGPWLWQDDQLVLVDDYGHHPTEIAVTLERIAEIWPNRRVVQIFQPHRYTRLRNLYEDFVEVLSTVDLLVVLDTYAAGEQPIPGVDSRSLCRSIRTRSHLDPVFVTSVSKATDVIWELLVPGDVVLVQGAGSISQLSKDLICRFDNTPGASHVG